MSSSTPYALRPTPSISLIYARSENRCIGSDGRIPWRLPDDFAHFKRTTMGKPIIMGRRTYEDHDSALPGRLNIVITSRADYPVAEGVLACDSLDAAIEISARESDEVFVIGGVGPFAAAFPKADRVYETIVHTDVDGDAFLPDFDFTGWTTTVMQEHPADDRHTHAFTVLLHERR